MTVEDTRIADIITAYTDAVTVPPVTDIYRRADVESTTAPRRPRRMRKGVAAAILTTVVVVPAAAAVVWNANSDPLGQLNPDSKTAPVQPGTHPHTIIGSIPVTGGHVTLTVVPGQGDRSCYLLESFTGDHTTADQAAGACGSAGSEPIIDSFFGAGIVRVAGTKITRVEVTDASGTTVATGIRHGYGLIPAPAPGPMTISAFDAHGHLVSKTTFNPPAPPPAHTN